MKTTLLSENLTETNLDNFLREENLIKNDHLRNHRVTDKKHVQKRLGNGDQAQ